MHFIHRPYIPNETVAAIATAPGEGGIAVIRVSGSDSFSIVQKIFTGTIASYATHTVHLGKIVNREGIVLDEILLLIMRAPRSFTGEDTIEIHCHGGNLIAKKILQELIFAGAKPALPGQFSLKAFMNGKIDLTQAEAIQQVISAKNDLAMHAAEGQLQGSLSTKIKMIQKKIIDISAILEAWVDFPEEGLEFASMEEICLELEESINETKKLSNSFKEGKLLHEGLSLCLIGPPNAGKSSLMNCLLGKARAIVTDIAGTTRDTLEDFLYIGELHVKLIDTAGIRSSEEIVEQEGIKRSQQAMQESDLTLLVLDSSTPLCENGLTLLNNCDPNKTVLIWNKSDLTSTKPPDKTFPFTTTISTKTGEGMDHLKTTIYQAIWQGGPPAKEEIFLTQFRHKQAIDAAHESLSSVLEGLKTGVSPEFLSFEIRKALFELGTILGMDISEEVLSSIFSKFCVGK